MLEDWFKNTFKSLMDSTSGTMEIFYTFANILQSAVKRNRLSPVNLIPKKRNKVILKIYDANGKLKSTVNGYNSRVNLGAAWQAQIMGNESGNPAKFIALSSSVITPNSTDMTLTGEITNYGLARTVGTFTNYTAPSTLGGGASYQITHQYTATGNITVQSSALFDAISGGNLFVEANFQNQAVLSNGDNLVLTWQINI
jgi:hypothetical protein